MEKREDGCGVAFTQGGGLGGLTLGYYPAAPPGRRKANHAPEPVADASNKRNGLRE